jgi:uncharacterized membrane protein YcaP (DUF421 family)
MESLRALIGPDTGAAAWWQLCARAVIIFVFGVVCIRIAGRRTFSQATPLDIIVALIIGSNLARCMTGKAPFVGGLAASLVLVLLHRLVAMATLRWGWLAALMKAKPTVLIRDGQIDEAALTRHGLTRGDLDAGLRMEQTDSPETVRLAMLEDSGQISVIPKSKAA